MPLILSNTNIHLHGMKLHPMWHSPRCHYKVQNLRIVNDYRVVIVLLWVRMLIYNLSHHYDALDFCKELALLSNQY